MWGEVRRRRRSEGLVLTTAVVTLLVMVWVVKMVGLVSVVAVTDDRVLDAFTLEILLLVNSVQLGHQLHDENLRSSNHEEITSTQQLYWHVCWHTQSSWTLSPSILVQHKTLWKESRFISCLPFPTFYREHKLDTFQKFVKLNGFIK